MVSALALKPDWAEAQQRLTAWWKGEIVDRVCLGITAPKDNPGPRPPMPDVSKMTLEEYYLNAEVRIAQIEHRFSGTVWLGDAFPNASLNLGPGSLALYLGSQPGYRPTTIWYHRWPPAAEGALPEYDENNPFWIKHQEMLTKLAQAAKGRYVPNIPDLIEAMDILASLRGNQELLVDLIDKPEWVHACQERLVDLYFKYYDRCFDICKLEDGSVGFTAFELWGPGRTSKLQTDFSAMISPGMFAELQVPYLRRICRRLDYTLYHLDGTCALQHLDHLIAMPELNAIQWTPGAGHNGVLHEEWYPLYRRMLDGGKNIQLLAAEFDRDGIDRLIRTFGPNRFYITCNAPSQKEGEEMLAYAERNWR